MIFADGMDAALRDKEDLRPLTVAAMLLACAEEAKRMADALVRMDRALATNQFREGYIPVALQEIDLLRQEGIGLASILEMIAEDPNPLRELEPATVAGKLAVWSQCVRLHAAAAASLSK